jgi:glycosyltransferase involved in cell wall biosynthesis
MEQNLPNLKILVSCGSYSWGGLEMVALQSAIKLKETGADVKIICAVNSSLQKESISRNIETVPVYKSNIRSAFSISKLTKLIREFKPDVIHTHLSHDLSVITPALNLTRSKAKLFLTKHIASGVRKTDIFHRYLYKRLSGIFSVSNYINESVIRTCPVAPEKIHILPNGIQPEEFDIAAYDKTAIKTGLNIPGNKTVISIIGRMTPGKGHEELLKAAKIINEKHQDDVFFLVVGTASAGEEEFEKKIRALSQELNIKNILFTGYVKDITKILAITDILAFPSHNESFGVALIEAMAMMVPVAASGYAGVLDIVTDNETGLLFEPRDPVQLAGALLRLIEDKELRVRLAEAGRKEVEKKFNIDDITNRLIEYYKN